VLFLPAGGEIGPLMAGGAQRRCSGVSAARTVTM
jgi:hypothetical protein